MARFLPGKSMPGIAKLMPAKMPGPTDAGGYTPPPTDRDLAQSVVHHTDSAAQDFRHAGAHIDEARRAVQGGDRESALYNLQHAGRHTTDGLGHAQAGLDRMSDSPRFQPHVQGLGGRNQMSPSGGGGGMMGDDGQGPDMERPPTAQPFQRKTSRPPGGRFKGRR